MAWVLLEGIDRTGKSTVADLYKSRGYEVVHMAAPSKKYKEAGYAGPSYLDDMLDMYMQYDNKDVIFDRTIYGETVWPHVYGREPMLSEDDIEILQDFESRNSAQRILMMDSDVAAHWKRCVDNKEPLNNNQFRTAAALFNKMAHKYNFLPKELKDYKDVKAADNKSDSAANKQESPLAKGQAEAASTSTPANTLKLVAQPQEETELSKLEKANAIRDVLSKRILKQKGGTFDRLEEDLKNFLKTQLSGIFKEQQSQVSLTGDEISVLKIFCQRIKEKEGSKK
jgi:thymidylate kinase